MSSLSGAVCACATLGEGGGEGGGNISSVVLKAKPSKTTAHNQSPYLKWPSVIIINALHCMCVPVQ